MGAGKRWLCLVLSAIAHTGCAEANAEKVRILQSFSIIPILPPFNIEIPASAGAGIILRDSHKKFDVIELNSFHPILPAGVLTAWL